jgi:hypothetical protein
MAIRFTLLSAVEHKDKYAMAKQHTVYNAMLSKLSELDLFFSYAYREGEL